MLIVNRKKGEKIEFEIGELKIDLYISNIGEKRVKIGINAPKEIKINFGQKKNE